MLPPKCCQLCPAISLAQFCVTSEARTFPVYGIPKPLSNLCFLKIHFVRQATHALVLEIEPTRQFKLDN